MHSHLRHDSYGGRGVTAAAAVLQVLLVEDDLGDAALMERSFAERRVATALHHVADGAEAHAFLRREGGYADMPSPVRSGGGAQRHLLQRTVICPGAPSGPPATPGPPPTRPAP